MKVARISLCLGAVFLGVGCAAPNPLDETSQGVGLTAATARSSSLALDAMAGTGPSCASVVTACTTYPCDGEVKITLGGDCGYRLGLSGGSVTVSGSWSDANSAKVTSVFTDVNAGGKTYAFASVKELQVDRSGQSTTVRYSAANAMARSGSTTALATTNNWTAVVDSKGTADQNDDTMTISSSSVSAGAGLGNSVAVIQLDSVLISPDCDKNPISGSGNSTKIEGIIPKIDTIKFHSACDGKAEFNNTSYSCDVNVTVK
jgi:hypothetical protein